SKDITYEMDVVGVMKEDYKKGYVTSAGILMDLTVLKRIESEYMKMNGIKESSNSPRGYDSVIIKVDDMKNVKEVEDKIKALGFGTDSATGQRENMQKQSQAIQMVLGGLGAVSLFVAALSIANTMTMAIYERTREIGVMKVLGCGLGKIRTMFLLEAAMIGFLGGVFGVVLSYTLSLGLNYFAPLLMQSGLGNFLPMFGTKISVIPPWLALVGITFSTIIGILSGIMPANRAVKISALEAIRHE
ncbi:MAG: FtsX-like permease family protein, partial [Oscillospiraceae bacterium]